MYIACRIFNGLEYTTKTRIRWGMRNPTWNHRSIFSIPSEHSGWAHHLSTNSIVLEVWDRPIPLPTKTAAYNNKNRPHHSPTLPVDANDRLVGIATVPLRNHLGFDLLQLASPHTPYPVRDIVSGRNAGFIFLDASIGPFQHIHSLFKLHAVRTLQRTWRRKLQRRNPPPPISPPPPDEPSTPIHNRGKRRTATVHTTPAPRRTPSPTTTPHHITTTSVLPHQATLSITVLQAKLHSIPSLSKPPNTFIVYALPAGIGEPQATCIRHSTTNPIWNHSYSTSLVLDQRTVSILHQPHKYITFEMWHKYDSPSQPVSVDHEKLLGSAELPLASLLDASKRNSPTRASVDIYSPPPATRSIGILEIEFSLGPSSSTSPEHLTSSHEWVINTLTKYRQVLNPTHPTYSTEHCEYNNNHAEVHSDNGEDFADIRDTIYNGNHPPFPNTNNYSRVTSPHYYAHTQETDPINHSEITAAVRMTVSPTPNPSTPSTNPDSEWKWLSELDKELSIQTDITLKTRHAKNMLELDALLNKLNSSGAEATIISFLLFFILLFYSFHSYF